MTIESRFGRFFVIFGIVDLDFCTKDHQGKYDVGDKKNSQEIELSYLTVDTKIGLGSVG